MKAFKTEYIRSLDNSNMLNLLLDFPKQLNDARNIGRKIGFTVKYDFNKVVFTGLGGSAIGADLVRSYTLKECKIPVIVNRDYTVPEFIDDNTLFIVSSYSGNTEETLSACDEGLKKGAKIVAITSDGRLKEIAKRENFFLISIPQGFPPRCALGYSSIPIILLFSKIGLISDKEYEIEESINVLNDLKNTQLSPDIEEGNIAKDIAGMLFGKYIIVYGANQYTDVVATRWRGQLAENAKTLSSTHLFPEMNHNEIVGWANPKNLLKDLIVVMLRDKGDHPRVRKRMDISKIIIENTGSNVVEVISSGKGLLSRLFSLIYIGDFASFYLAILNNVDPTPVDNITYLKKELAKM